MLLCVLLKRFEGETAGKSFIKPLLVQCTHGPALCSWDEVSGVELTEATVGQSLSIIQFSECKGIPAFRGGVMMM